MLPNQPESRKERIEPDFSEAPIFRRQGRFFWAPCGRSFSEGRFDEQPFNGS